MFPTTRCFSRSVRWVKLKSTKWEKHQMENRVELDKEAVTRYSRERALADRRERHPGVNTADCSSVFEEDFGGNSSEVKQSHRTTEPLEPETTDSKEYAKQRTQKSQQQQQQQSEQEDDFVFESLGGAAQDKFVDSEIMKMESRVLKAATRKEADISLQAVTNPMTSIFTFNGRIVPPPPTISNILVPSAVSMGHDVYVKKKFELVYEGGPYDTYLDTGPNAASEVALFGAQTCGKTSLINAITEQNLGADTNRKGGAPSIGFYQCPDKKLWKESWSDGPTKYPAATRISKTHWGGMLVDLPGFRSNTIRPDSTDLWYQTINQYYEGTRRQLKGTFYCIDALKGLTHSDRKWLSIVSDLHTRVSLCTIVITKADAVEHHQLCKLMKKIYTVIGRSSYSLKINLPIVVTSALYGWGIEELRGYITLQSEMLPWWKRVEEQKAFVESLKGDVRDSQYELSHLRRLQLTKGFKNLDEWNNQAHEAINTAEYGSAEQSREAEFSLVALEKKIPELGINIPNMGARHNSLIKNKYIHDREPGLAPTTLEDYVAEEEVKKSTFDEIVQQEAASQLEVYRNQATSYPSLQQEYQKEFVTRVLGENNDARRGVEKFEPSFYSDPDITKEEWDSLSMEETQEKLNRKGETLTEKMNYGFDLDDIREDAMNAEDFNKSELESATDDGVGNVIEVTSSEQTKVSEVINTTSTTPIPTDICITTKPDNVVKDITAEEDYNFSLSDIQRDIQQEDSSNDITVALEPVEDLSLPPRGIYSFEGFKLRVHFNAGQLGRFEFTKQESEDMQQPEELTVSQADLDLAKEILKAAPELKKSGTTQTVDINPEEHQIEEEDDVLHKDEYDTTPTSDIKLTPEEQQSYDNLKIQQQLESDLDGNNNSFSERDTLSIANQVLRLKGGSENIKDPENKANSVEDTLDAAADSGFGLPKSSKDEVRSPRERWNKFTKLLNSVPGDVLLAAQPVHQNKKVFRKRFAEKKYGKALQLDDRLGKNNEPVELSTELIESEIKERQMGPHFMGFPWMSHEQIPTAIAVHSKEKAIDMATASSKINQKALFRTQNILDTGTLTVKEQSQRALDRHNKDAVMEEIEEHHHFGKRRTRVFEEGLDIDTNVKRFKELRNGKVEGPKGYTTVINYGHSQGVNSKQRSQTIERLVRQGKLDKLTADGVQDRYVGSPAWKKNLSLKESVTLGFSHMNAYTPQHISINAKGKVKMSNMSSEEQMDRNVARKAFDMQQRIVPKTKARILGTRRRL